MAVDVNDKRVNTEIQPVDEGSPKYQNGLPGPQPGLQEGASAPPPDTETSEAPTRFRIPQNLQVIFALVFGLAVGGFAVHKHDTAQIPIAVVNGYIINKEHFFNRMQEAGGAATIHEMVTEELQLQYAKKLDALPTQKEIDERYEEMQKDPQVRAQMIASGQSEPTLKRALAIQLAQTNVVAKGVKVTSADALNFYNRNVDHNNPQAQFYQPATISISVIECHSQDKIQQAADDIQLRQDPFELVAHEYSEDPTGQQGGRIADIVYGRTKLTSIPGMQDAIFNLQVGQILGPQRFAGQWWLIRCDDKTPSVTASFNQVRQECIDGATLEKGLPTKSKQIQTDFELFQKNAKIRAIWPQYTAAVTFNKE